MSHFWKFSVIAAVSLVFFTPLATHAQVRDWDYDRIDALVEELEDFQYSFDLDDEEVSDAFDTVRDHLEDFDVPDEEPIYIESLSTNAEATTVKGGQGYGTYTIKFDVTAIDEDFCVAKSSGDDLGVGAQYRIDGADMKITQTSTLTSTAPLKRGCFVVGDGETETFTLTVSIVPERTGAFAVALRSVESASGYRVLIEDERDFITKKLLIPVGSTSLETYRGYLDGSLFITTKNITEAAALQNCKLNASNNATKSIRCTWGTKEIYRKDVVVPPSGTIATKKLYEIAKTHVISGTAKNTPSIGLIIEGSSGDKVYASGKILVDSAGRWSVKVPRMSAGTYTLKLLGEKDVLSIASGTLIVEPSPEVLPSVQTKTSTPTVSPTTTDQPEVLPVETSPKSMVDKSSLSASANVALEQLLEAFRAYLTAR